MSQNLIAMLSKAVVEHEAARAEVDALPDMDMSNPMSAIKHAKQSKPVFEAYQAAGDALARTTAFVLLSLMKANLTDDAPDTPAQAGDIAEA